MRTTNLFCLPFAGGSKYAYQGFCQAARPNVRVIPVELPGRGARVREPLLTDVHLMAEDVFTQIKPSLDQPYALYGHSMGTLLGLLAARRITAAGLPPPRHLFVTGSKAPSAREQDRKCHLLPREAFIREVRELGGSPDEVIASESLMAFFEPILRADFQAVETYRYQPAAKLDVPITVLTGTEEDIDPVQALAWQRETSSPLDYRRLPGKHFFIFQHESLIQRLIAEKLM